MNMPRSTRTKEALPSLEREKSLTDGTQQRDAGGTVIYQSPNKRSVEIVPDRPNGHSRPPLISEALGGQYGAGLRMRTLVNST